MRRHVFLALLAALAACNLGSTSGARRTAPRQDGAAQQRAYDRGVARFSEEKYEEARKAFAEAARLGPGTPLGRKAQDNLAKTETILKNLREIEAAR